MKIITDTKSLSILQKKSISGQDEVKEEYLKLAEIIYKPVNLLLKLKHHFSLPPSLRFYHNAERVAKGDDLKRLKYLRRIYHDMYWIKSEMLKAEESFNTIICLDSFETKAVMRVAKHLEVEINSYSKEVDVNNEIQMANINQIINC